MLQMEPGASVFTGRRGPESETEDPDKNKTCKYCQKLFSKPANLLKHLENNKKCSPLYYDELEGGRKRPKSSTEDIQVKKWTKDEQLAGYLDKLMACDFIK